MNGGTDGVNVHLNGHGQGDARQLPKPTWALETAAGGGQDHAGVAKLKVQLADAQAALAAQAATARARDGQVAEQAATMRADLAKARNELTVKCAEVGQLRAQLSAKVAVPEPTDACSEAQTELAEKFTELQALRAELDSANEGTRTAKAQATAEVAEAKAALAGLARKVSELQRLQSELEAATEKATAEAADAKAPAEILKSEMEAAQAESKRAQARCTELSDELRKVRSVQSQLQAQLDKLQAPPPAYTALKQPARPATVPPTRRSRLANSAPVANGSSAVATREELMQLKLSELKKRAKAQGVEQGAIDSASNYEKYVTEGFEKPGRGAKLALINLIVAAA